MPDNFEVEIEGQLIERKITDEEIEQYVQTLRDEFVKEYKEKYGIDKSNDPFLKLIGSDAKFSRFTSYLDDKKRIIDAVSEKHSMGDNE
ncbi:MAG TPA: hypothetical protein ENI76_01845 [Ignavibacteria bacterium]|nr:hypothetical protein [Ignavibacteria bacterium]